VREQLEIEIKSCARQWILPNLWGINGRQILSQRSSSLVTVGAFASIDQNRAAVFDILIDLGRLDGLIL